MRGHFNMEILKNFSTQFMQSIQQTNNIISVPFHLYGQSSQIHFLIKEQNNNYIITTQCHDLLEHLAWNMGDIQKYQNKINEICQLFKIQWYIDRNIYFSYTCKKEETANGIFQLINALSLIGHLGYSLFAFEK